MLRRPVEDKWCWTDAAWSSASRVLLLALTLGHGACVTRVEGTVPPVAKSTPPTLPRVCAELPEAVKVGLRSNRVVTVEEIKRIRPLLSRGADPCACVTRESLTSMPAYSGNVRVDWPEDLYGPAWLDIEVVAPTGRVEKLLLGNGAVGVQQRPDPATYSCLMSKFSSWRYVSDDGCPGKYYFSDVITCNPDGPIPERRAWLKEQH